MTGITADGVAIDRDFAASPAAVFAAWTTPEHFARWFGGKDVEVPVDTLDFIAEPGRTWHARMVLPNGTTIEWTGRFIEVVPDERLVFTLTDRPDEPVQAEVVVELTAIPTGTRMHFTQQAPGFSPEEKESLIAGWESFIDELERIASA